MVMFWKKLRLALLATIVLHGYGTCAVPVQAALTSSNIPAHTHASTQQGGALGAVNATSVTATGAVTGGSVSTSGGGDVNGGNFISTGSVTALGVVSGGSVTATGAVSGGSIATSGTLSSTKACAAGYTRVGPNFCHRGTQTPTVYVAVRDTCVAIASPSADAKALMLHAETQARSNNGVLQRFVIMTWYQNSGCSVGAPPLVTVQNYAYEHVAVVAATTISGKSDDIIVYSGNAGGGLWFFMSDDAGNQATGAVRLVGYFD